MGEDLRKGGPRPSSLSSSHPSSLILTPPHFLAPPLASPLLTQYTDFRIEKWTSEKLFFVPIKQLTRRDGRVMLYETCHILSLTREHPPPTHSPHPSVLTLRVNGSARTTASLLHKGEGGGDAVIIQSVQKTSKIMRLRRGKRGLCPPPRHPGPITMMREEVSGEINNRKPNRKEVSRKTYIS